MVIEVGTHSRWVSELLRELGHDVTVANPRRVKLISQSSLKRDKKDAEWLARLGKADVQLLAPVHHRGGEAQADLAVTKARDALVRTRTKLINQARGLVKSFGERLPSCTAESFHRKARTAVPQALKPALDPLFCVLERLEEQIDAYDDRVKQLAKKYPDVEAIAQPKGVGILTALVFLLTLEDKTRFNNSRTVDAFIGFNPKSDQSGDSDKQLGISKTGDGFVRRLAVGSANYILGPFGQDTTSARSTAARAAAASRRRLVRRS